MSAGLDLNSCGQMKAAAHPARKEVKQDVLELVIFWLALEKLLFSCQCDFSPGPPGISLTVAGCLLYFGCGFDLYMIDHFAEL